MSLATSSQLVSLFRLYNNFLKKFSTTSCESLLTEAVHFLDFKKSQEVLQNAPSIFHPNFLTIADLDDKDSIAVEHLLEALHFRTKV